MTMTVEEAKRLIDVMIEKIGEIAEVADDLAQRLGQPASAIGLLDSFLMSEPFEMATYDDEDFKFSVSVRVDILDAFKRHCLAKLTGICPDCGQPMDSHTHTEVAPPKPSVN